MRAQDLTDEANEAAGLPWREPGLPPRPGSAALFKSRVLDAFTRSHPAMPYVVALPIALVELRNAILVGVAPLAIVGLVALGWASWSVLEYLMHRYLFHLEAKSETTRIAVLLAHGHHHVWPHDRSRIAATPIQFGSVALLFHGIFTLALGDDLRHPALAGALLGYVAYEWVHWVTHHGRPRTRLFKWLQAHHMKHHHVAPRSRWGIGTPFWDHVFRTHD